MMGGRQLGGLKYEVGNFTGSDSGISVSVFSEWSSGPNATATTTLENVSTPSHGTTGTVGDSYWFDAASQLRGVKYSVSNATASYSGLSASLFSEWAYDAVGNRASQTGSSGPTTYTVNDINQYTAVTGDSTPAYSARGDLTQFGDWTYTYDVAGNLIRAHNTQNNVLEKYWRDADGHLAVEDVNGEKTVFFNLGTT